MSAEILPGDSGSFADLSYILNELGEDRDQYFGAVAPPIMQTSNFAFKTVAEFQQALEKEYDTHLYSRGSNPTTDILRKKLAALDRAEDALVFNSGSSAIFAAVVSQVKAGDHIVSVNKPYTWAQQLFDRLLSRFGVATTYIDGTRIENFEKAILPNTRVIYLESPNSWDFALQDLAAVADLAKAEGITTICDNSYCTPLYQQPIKLGIDMSLQSASKYIGGHSDVVAGVLTGTRETMKKIFDNEMLISGNGISPFNAWLLLRGLRTLPVRLAAISRTTQHVVAFLKNQEKVEQVLFPLDPSFPQYDLAKQQMSGACGLFTIILRCETRAEIILFCESFKHVLMAVSWGGYESLLMPRCAVIRDSDFDAAIPAHRSVRFYIGLEEPDYLLTDLERAFASIK